MNISDLLKEYLHQGKNNVFCYAGDYLMNTPKKGYDREFFEAQERVELLEDLLERIKEETV